MATVMGSFEQVHSSLSGPLPLQLWKTTVTIPAAATSISIEPSNKCSGTVVGVWIDPTTLTASATIKGYNQSDGLTTPRYFLNYTVPAAAVESRNLLNRRMRVFGKVQIDVASATAADSFTIYVWVDPDAGTFDINYPTISTATIANNGTVSSAVDCEGLVPVALLTAANLTGTTMTFQGSYDDNTYTAIYDTSGSAVSITVASSRWISLGDVYQYFTGLRSLKLVSGSTETGGDTIQVIMRPLS